MLRNFMQNQQPHFIWGLFWALLVKKPQIKIFT